jgi:hypothetical protein
MSSLDGIVTEKKNHRRHLNENTTTIPQNQAHPRQLADLDARTGSVEADSVFRGCAGCVGIVEGFVK